MQQPAPVPTSSPSGRYNVVIISPTGYGFSETFREIGQTLDFALKRLGYESRLSVNQFDTAAVNIVLGGHLLDDAAAARVPTHSIIYNFEQVHGGSKWIKPVYVGLIRRFTCWDYSLRNIQQWKRLCPEAAVVHVPLGYVPELTRIAKAQHQDIDVFFYGVGNERRAKILKDLEDAGLKVAAVTGVFGPERDALIARSKVVLNVHYFETKILEMSRISYLLANRVAVVTELDADTEAEADIRDAVAGVPYGELVDKCFDLAFNDPAREELAERGFKVFGRRSEPEILAAALASAVTRASPLDAPLPKLINVGSGKKWDLEALNIDADAHWMPDLVADFNRPLPSPDPVDLGRFGVRPLPAGYFDEIVASHVLEHFTDLVTAMGSFLRLLRLGGILSVEVPHELGYGAWQDPTHVRALNERSWLYYTDWYWYLGWNEFRFEVVTLQYGLSEHGQRLAANGTHPDEIARTPRAVDTMLVRLRKIALTEQETVRAAQRWE